MKPNINWIIHLVMNGVRCAECGDVENSFMPFTCNCHTHGMEQYGHPNFQVVINYPDEEIGYILNSLVFGCRPVRNSRMVITWKVSTRIALFV